MNQKEKEVIKSLMDDFISLESDFNERISELYEVQGGQAERHAFCYYRKQLWEIKYQLRDLL